MCFVRPSAGVPSATRAARTSTTKKATAKKKTAKKATEKKLCLLVDYQLPTDPANQELRQRIRDGALGGVAHIYSGGTHQRWR